MMSDSRLHLWFIYKEEALFLLCRCHFSVKPQLPSVVSKEKGLQWTRMSYSVSLHTFTCVGWNHT